MSDELYTVLLAFECNKNPQLTKLVLNDTMLGGVRELLMHFIESRALISLVSMP